MKRRTINIPFAVKRRFWGMPCAVCGVPFNIHVDHVKPVVGGGGDSEENLQPLCRGCNYIKKHKLANPEVAQEVRRRGMQHFLKAVSEYEQRYDNPFDYYSPDRWAKKNPAKALKAIQLYAAFSIRQFRG
jgi:hypothetical protein